MNFGFDYPGGVRVFN